MKKMVKITALFLGSLLLAHTAQAQAPKVEIKKSTLTSNQAESIKKILADASPETYNFTYAEKGRAVSRAGSASMKQLSTVKAYSRLGVGDGKAANEVLTSVDNYVKTIWTSKFGQMYPEKVRQINQILEKSAMQR